MPATFPARAGHSARGVLGQIRRALVAAAQRAHRRCAVLLDHPASKRTRHAKEVAHTIGQLRHARPPEPLVADSVERWFAARAVRVLHAQGIVTLADLTGRIPRRRQWWKGISDLGATSAKQIEAIFAAYTALTGRPRALVEINSTRSRPTKLVQLHCALIAST